MIIVVVVVVVGVADCGGCRQRRGCGVIGGGCGTDAWSGAEDRFGGR